MPEEYEDSDGRENLERPPSFFPYDGEQEGEAGTEDYGEPIEVNIEGVFRAEANGQVTQYILLTDSDGRRLPILIGPAEAHSIIYPLEGGRPDRPLTHDLICVLLERLKGTVDRVVIDDLWNTTYYAKIYVRQGKDEMEVDARPSDAIAIAIRVEAPIFVSDGILERNAEA